jgi:ABC-type nitrate/sulfonate/bicarbonate transport system substrate-binding protein
MTSKDNSAQHSVDTLWFSRCSIPTPLGIGAHLGFYQDEFSAEGIKIKSLQESDDPVEKASHYEHSLPHSFRLGGAVPPIWTRAKGRDTRVIGISWIDEYQVILSLPGSGINSPKDLRGRKLGLPLSARKNSVDVARASAQKGFVSALDLAGIGYKEVEWVDVADEIAIDQADEKNVAAPDTAVRRARRHSYTNVALALVRGDVDAIYVKDVRGAETAHLLGAQVVVDLGFHPDPLVRINNCAPRPLTVNTETLEQHPELVRRFLNRVVNVGPWARNNPAAALAQVSHDTNWTEAWIRFTYRDIHNKLDVNLNDESIQGLNVFKNFLLEWKFIEKDFDINDWIYPRPLEDILASHKKVAASA